MWVSILISFFHLFFLLVAFQIDGGGERASPALAEGVEDKGRGKGKGRARGQDG